MTLLFHYLYLSSTQILGIHEILWLHPIWFCITQLIDCFSLFMLFAILTSFVVTEKRI